MCGQQLGGSYSEAIDNCFCCRVLVEYFCVAFSNTIGPNSIGPFGSRGAVPPCIHPACSPALADWSSLLLLVVLLHLEPWAHTDELCWLAQNWFDVSICIGISLHTHTVQRFGRGHSLRYFLSLFNSLHLSSPQTIPV